MVSVGGGSCRENRHRLLERLRLRCSVHSAVQTLQGRLDAFCRGYGMALVVAVAAAVVAAVFVAVASVPVFDEVYDLWPSVWWWVLEKRGLFPV